MIAVTVNSPLPDFTITSFPAGVTIEQGSSGSTTIIVKPSYGFSSDVKLRSTDPGGFNIAFNPTSIPGSGNSTMSITVASSVETGPYTITVSGTSGTSIHVWNMTVTVTAIEQAPAQTIFGIQATIFYGGIGVVAIVALAAAALALRRRRRGLAESSA
jgi:hypothetical protein